MVPGMYQVIALSVSTALKEFLIFTQRFHPNYLRNIANQINCQQSQWRYSFRSSQK
ncbi:unnamed protein product [Paramecium octaurelia]|uniref:Uncharacterized protein n=1 Tax=Paramecium octaurelia TaxID=43137 RepID=A0A8S1XFQ5_PAROT|nr:unnamed protein product [Paramecium octaurelia]